MRKLSWYTENLYTGFIVLILFTTKSRSQEVPVAKVNLLLMYEDIRHEELFNHAIKYVGQNRMEFGFEIGEVHRFDSRNYSSPLSTVILINDFCIYWDRIVESQNPPDIALDFTNSIPLKAMLRAVQIPTIATTFNQELRLKEWKNLTSVEKQYLIQVSPPFEMLVQSVRSLADLQEMQSAAVVFDKDSLTVDDIRRRNLLLDFPTRHLIIPLEYNNLTGQALKLVHIDMANFFIAASPNAISDMLARASSRNVTNGPYFSDEFAWHSMSLEEGVPRCTGCENDMTLIHLSPEPIIETKEKDFLRGQVGAGLLTLTQIFYFDITLTAIRAVAAMKLAGEWNHDISNKSCDSLAPWPDNDYPEANLTLFNALETAANDSILTYHLRYNGQNYPDFTMNIQRLTFKPNIGEPAKIEDIGIWRSGIGGKDLIQFAHGKNLKANKAMVVYRIVVVVNEPFIIKKNCTKDNNKYSNNSCYKGICIDLLDILTAKLQFNYTIRAVHSSGFMRLTWPPIWSSRSMMRALVDKEADIALSAFSIMAERETAIEFTVPFYDLVGLSVLMKTPEAQTQPNNLFMILAVLDIEVWMCMIGTFFGTSILIWIYDLWSPYSYRNNRAHHENDAEKRVYSFKESIWFCMASLTPQGGGAGPKNVSGRLVVASWWFFSFVTLAFYSANLAAFLTTSRIIAPIDSLDDLSKQNLVQYSPVVNTTAWYYFLRMAHIEKLLFHLWKDIITDKENKDDEYEQSRLGVYEFPMKHKYTKMWDVIQASNPPTTREIAHDRIRGINASNPKQKLQRFALIDETTRVRWATRVNCNFRQIGEEFSRKPYSIGVQKDSPLKEAFSRIILKLLDEKWIDTMKGKWWNYNTKKCDPEKSQADGMSVENVGGIFIVQFIVIFMAFLWGFVKGCRNRQSEKDAVVKLTGDEPIGQEKEDMNLPEALDEDEIYVISEDTVVVNAHGVIQPGQLPEILSRIRNAW